MKIPFINVLQKIAGFFSASGSSPIIDIPSGGTFIVRIGGVEAFRVDGNGAAIPAGRNLGLRGTTTTGAPRLLSSTNKVLELTSAETCVIAGSQRQSFGISTDQNNYAISNGPATMNVLQPSANINITGWQAYPSGTFMFVVNNEAFSVTFKHESASSTAANRFACPGSTDVVLNQYETLLMVYNGTLSRWSIAKL